MIMQTMNMLTGAPETRNPQKANFERQFPFALKKILFYTRAFGTLCALLLNTWHPTLRGRLLHMV
jgi:hypothetical protein